MDPASTIDFARSAILVLLEIIAPSMLTALVVGLGIDVASLDRIRRSLDRFGDRLWQRILTENERRDLASRPDHALALAGRFAAKAAAAKALGGQPDVWWHEIEVRSGVRGAPELTFRGPALTHAARLGVRRILVSITHDAGVAARAGRVIELTDGRVVGVVRADE